jgi:hypothetical protein
LPTVSSSASSAAQISAGCASSDSAAAATGSTTVSVGGSTGACLAASERLGDIAVDAFRDRSKFLGHSSVATVEKSRLGVNELACFTDNDAASLRKKRIRYAWPRRLTGTIEGNAMLREENAFGGVDQKRGHGC